MSLAKAEDKQAELLKKVREIELRTRRWMKTQLLGQYRSRFRGQGMIFSDFREYVPGDDVRAISWNLTAKTGKTFIKKFEEEREMQLVLAVDVSQSMEFGSKSGIKRDLVSLIAGALAISALSQGDLVGLLLFSEDIELFIHPKKGRSHFLRLIREMLVPQRKYATTNIARAVDFLTGVLKKKSVVFFLSDFKDQKFEESFQRFAKKHEVITCRVSDPLEQKFPSISGLQIENMETGETQMLDVQDPAFQNFIKSENQIEEQQKKTLKKFGIEEIQISTLDDPLKKLSIFFSRRKR